MGHHNHDYEECPEEPVVMAWLDVGAARLCVLVHSCVDGERMNVLLCSSQFTAYFYMNVAHKKSLV